MPQQVHKWMLRHVYYPSREVGIPKLLAGVLVFFVSAVFHELLVGLPLHMLKAWSFIGIMSQVLPMSACLPAPGHVTSMFPDTHTYTWSLS